MLDEVAAFVLQDLLGESLHGLVARARSPKARRMKVAGWSCCVAAVASFSAVAWGAPLMRPATGIGVGAVAMFSALGFGLWASLINAYPARRPQ